MTFPDFALARYNPDGSLDSTFGGDGRVTTSFGGCDGAFDVAIQQDQKIVAGGFAEAPIGDDFAFARYLPDGSLDPGFDSDGMATTDFASDADESHGLAIQGDGRIVAAGIVTTLFGQSRSSTFGLVRYRVDGSLDTAFREDGRIVTDFGPRSERALAVAIQEDGRSVAVGCDHGCTETPDQSSDFAVARYKVDAGEADLSLAKMGPGRVCPPAVT